MISLCVTLLGIYLGLGYLAVKNALVYVKDSKEFTEKYNSKFDYYFDTVILTLFWLPIVFYGLIFKKIVAK